MASGALVDCFRQKNENKHSNHVGRKRHRNNNKKSTSGCDNKEFVSGLHQDKIGIVTIGRSSSIMKQFMCVTIIWTWVRWRRKFATRIRWTQKKCLMDMQSLRSQNTAGTCKKTERERERETKYIRSIDNSQTKVISGIYVFSVANYTLVRTECWLLIRLRSFKMPVCFVFVHFVCCCVFFLNFFFICPLLAHHFKH